MLIAIRAAASIRVLGYSQFVKIHLTKFLIGHFSNSFFRTSTDNIEMNFCLNMCTLIGKYLAFFSLGKVIFQSTVFWDKNAKICFLKITGFE